MSALPSIDCAAIRHPGQVRLRRTRAGIQKEFGYIEHYNGFRISLRETALVRNDGFGEMNRLNERYAACWLEVAKGKSIDHLQLGRGRLRLGERL